MCPVVVARAVGVVTEEEEGVGDNDDNHNSNNNHLNISVFLVARTNCQVRETVRIAQC